MDILETTYRDGGEIRGQDRVPLDEFLALGDQARISKRGQPFFSGREKEISAFRKVANDLFLGQRRDATIVVEGPFGAGKTALLSQFMREMAFLPPTGSGARRWLPVPIDASAAEVPLAIGDAVDRAIVYELSWNLLSSEPDGGRAMEPSQRLRDFLRGLRSPINWDLESTRDTAKRIVDGELGVYCGSISPKDRIDRIASQRAAAWSEWQIVLMIDEAQNISSSAPGAIPGTLSSIHQGLVPSPLSFCAFGLPGTAAALANAGVPRPSGERSFRLSGLDSTAAAMAVRRCLKQYGATHTEEWQHGILERSARWPQHLTAQLRGALTLLNGKPIAEKSIGDVRRSSLERALALGDEGRADDFQARTDRLNQRHPLASEKAKALASIMQAGPEGPAAGRDEVIKALMSDPWPLSGSDVRDFLWDAEQCGFMAPSGDGERFVMPIPTFSEHLLKGNSPNMPARKPLSGKAAPRP